MRKSLILFALAAFFFAACNDDDLVQDYTPAQVGDEISFGGDAAFENATNASKKEGRTVYGDKNGTGTELLWYKGDRVRIACPQARATEGNNHFVDYEVQNFVSPTDDVLMHDGKVVPHKTSLQRCVDETMGLQWGGTGKHDFYAVYPSVDQFSLATSGGDVSLMATESMEVSTYDLNCNGSTVTFTGYLPNSQDAPLGSEVTSKDGVYTVHPAMRYAYMVAKKTGVSPNGSPISLSFQPLVTAVELTLKNKAQPIEGDPSNTTSLNDVSMVILSSDEPICGKFTYNFQDGSCKLAEDNSHKMVAVSVKNKNNLPVSLKQNETLKVTFFLMPNVNLKKLNISVMSGSIIKTAKLLGQYGDKDFEIQMKKKNFINNIPILINQKEDSNWLSALPDTTHLYNLSIPGATNAFSSDIASTNATMADQTLNIDALWAKGVRCFELWTDCQTGTLTEESLVCGTQKFGTNLGNAMSALQQKIVDNPDEFVVVILGYQPIQGGSTNRQAAKWSQTFNEYWTNVANFTKIDGKQARSKKNVNKFIKLGRQTQYRPSLTLGEARGKLFVMTRCTAAGADGWWNSISMSDGALFKPNLSYYTSKVLGQVVAISGWGSLTDQWYKRGYEYVGFGRPELDGKKIGRPFYVGKELPKYQALIEENLNNPVNPNDYLKGKEQFDRPGFFAYDVFSDYNKVLGNELFVYAQDWRRVAETDFITQANGYTYFWPESYPKKLKDVKNALSAAKYTNKGFVKAKTILINCLSGFFITEDEPLSYKPIPYYRGCEKNILGKPDGNYMSNGNIEGQYDYIRHENAKDAYDDYGGYAGDIERFAKRMNKDAYDYILEVGVKNINYPLGIVMMSRIDNVQPKISDPNANFGGYYLPQIIIANNFTR